MRPTVLSLALILAVAFAPATLSTQPSSAPASVVETAASPVVATFNMCGYGGTGCGGTTAQRVGWIADVVTRENVQVLGLNEVCASQLSALRQALAARGVTVWTRLSVTYPANKGRCSGAESGNALVARSTPTNARATTFVAQPVGAVERRTVLCGTFSLAGVTELCSTHLLPGALGFAVRQRQVREALAFGQAPGRPVVLLGDFNDYPASDALDPVYAPRYPGGATGRYLEGASVRAGVPCRCGAPTRGTAKIDYVFASESTFQIGSSRTVDSPWSDHHLVLATLAR